MTKNSLRGFTLIELITIIAFLAVLATFAYPVYITALERAKITQDMNNLRQIGLATQSYLSDNDNNLFSSSPSWMYQLHPPAGASGTTYLPGWNVFQSPFDRRPALENDTTSPVSYGFNGNQNPIIIGMAAAKISKPSVFILFAPAQTSAAPTVTFQGTAGVTANGGVTVYKATSTPGGVAIGGPHSSRKQINAVFADLHSENMLWSVFINDAPNSSDPWAAQRWSP
jgi:type II secretory pathway pseudopilin PulG